MQTEKDDTRHVPLAEIQMHPELQPRALELLKVSCCERLMGSVAPFRLPAP